MNYPLENLTHNEFEILVALICSEILGTGTIVFSDGKDGGRDAEFYKNRFNKRLNARYYYFRNNHGNQQT